MTSLKDAATREAALKTLLDVVKGAYEEARAETQRRLEDAAAENGTRQVGVSLPDGADVATISLPSGKMTARVVDEAAFTAWVIAAVPTEIQRRFVTEVRPSFQKMMLDAMTASGAAEWADPETDAIHEVPGVELAPGRTLTHSMRFVTGGHDRVMEAWREGRLADIALPELTAGGGE